jgi:hypothetical protein
MVAVARPGAMSLTLASKVPETIEKRRKLTLEKQEVVKSELEKAKELLELLGKASIPPEEKEKIKTKIANLTSHVQETLQKQAVEMTDKSTGTATTTKAPSGFAASPQAKRRRLANEPIPPLLPASADSTLRVIRSTADVEPSVTESDTTMEESSTTAAPIQPSTTTTTAAASTTTNGTTTSNLPTSSGAAATTVTLSKTDEDRLEKLAKKYESLEKMVSV